MWNGVTFATAMNEGCLPLEDQLVSGCAPGRRLLGGRYLLNIGHPSRPLLRLLTRAKREPSTLHMTSPAGANQIKDLVDGR
jgi:hypothetical protein